ncbi:hypothetical protein VTN00DRAFT_4993 [Thermoascus crustaceus]|uniref:uncharacterized protein n=1 Tax=Thermoascus crustaceus TaxID=5088 RepID=UPI0037421DB6
MAGAIRDWPRLVRQCFENLSPGGWVEFQDIDTRLYSEGDDSVGPDNKVREMLDLLCEACDRIGRTLDPGSLLEGVRDAGFHKSTIDAFPCPSVPGLRIGVWCLWEIDYNDYTPGGGLRGADFRLELDTGQSDICTVLYRVC